MYMNVFACVRTCVCVCVCVRVCVCLSVHTFVNLKSPRKALIPVPPTTL